VELQRPPVARWRLHDQPRPCTAFVFFQALVQYNDRADLWSSNLRFGLLSDANTGLFIVYNDIQGLGSETPTGAGRTLTLKYSYLFDLLR
jgi:hypothetical protein